MNPSQSQNISEMVSVFGPIIENYKKGLIQVQHIREYLEELNREIPIGTGRLRVELIYARLWTYAMENRDSNIITLFGTVEPNQKCSLSCTDKNKETIRFDTCKYMGCIGVFHITCLFNQYEQHKSYPNIPWFYCKHERKHPLVLNVTGPDFDKVREAGEFEKIYNEWINAEDCDRHIKLQFLMYSLAYFFMTPIGPINDWLYTIAHKAISLPGGTTDQLFPHLLLVHPDGWNPKYPDSSAYFIYEDVKPPISTIIHLILYVAINEYKNVKGRAAELPYFQLLKRLVADFGVDIFTPHIESTLLRINYERTPTTHKEIETMMNMLTPVCKHGI